MAPAVKKTAASKTVKTEKAEIVAETAAPDVTAETPVTDAPVVAPATESTVDAVQAKFDAMSEKLAVVSNAIKDMQAGLKVLQREYSKLVKSASKRGRKNPGVKRPPSGFAKPAKLSDELCTFLNVPVGSELARTAVTRMLNDYIKDHKLQNAKDKRQIIPDDALRKIMNYKDGDNLSYFTLQSFIKHHFIRA